MKWNKLLNVDNGNQVVAAPRVFGNWHTKRAQLESVGRLVATHRIAPRRIVFEITDIQKSRSPRRLWRVLPFAVISAVLAVSVSFLFNSSLGGADVSQIDQGQGKPICESLALSKTKIDKITKFESGLWRVSTSAALQHIGAVQEFDFVATCQDKRLTGKLQAFEGNNEWTILKMTPTL